MSVLLVVSPGAEVLALELLEMVPSDCMLILFNSVKSRYLEV